MRNLLKLWLILLKLALWPVAIVVLVVTVAWSSPGSGTWQLWLLPACMGIAIWAGKRVLGGSEVHWLPFLIGHLPLVLWLLWAKFG